MISIGEIVLQSEIARRASERLQVANESFDHTEIWSSIQTILITTGNISKILWPNKKYEKRGERLREILNVEKNNLLLIVNLETIFLNITMKWLKNGLNTNLKVFILI
jgi:hypothetical protein